MALRYTETNKWKDDWFLSLSNDYRIIWLWLIDNCSIAGLWKKSFTFMNFFCGTKISEDEFKEVFKGRVFEIESGSYFFIPKFLKIQYPSGISSNKPLIISVRKELEKFNVNSIIEQSLGNDYLMIRQSYTGNIDTGNRKKRDKGGMGEKEIPKKEIPSVEEFLNYAKENLKEKFESLEFSIRMKYKSWVENGWKTGKDKEIKNWKTTLLNTIPYLEREKNVTPKKESLHEKRNRAYEEASRDFDEKFKASIREL